MNIMSLTVSFIYDPILTHGERNKSMQTEFIMRFQMHKRGIKIHYVEKRFILMTICCKMWENSNFLRKSKMIILVKIRIFSRSWMTKRTSPLESFREI